jgi:hypothetical protein
MSQAEAPADKDIDELDDFEDSEDENTSEFRVRDPLNPPTANLFSTQALHSMSSRLQGKPKLLTYFVLLALIHEGLIDLNPAYQRGELLFLEPLWMLNSTELACFQQTSYGPNQSKYT